MYMPVCFLFLMVVGVKCLSLAPAHKSIMEVSVDCGPNKATNSPVVQILTDVDISAAAKCQGGDQNFVSEDFVHYILPAAFTARDSRCLFYRRENSEHFAVEVEIHYGEIGGLILTKKKILTVICNFGNYGKDGSPEHSIRDGPIAPIEIQKIVGDTVPSSDLTLSIQTVDDQDAVGPIALDRRYSLYGTYTGASTNVGLKPVSCDAVSDDGDRYSVLRAGCGDGLIFDRSDGFTTDGLTFRSPYFVAFHLSSSENLAFDCNVTLCSPSCDGSSCEIFCGTVTDFSISNGVLGECTGQLYQDTCSFTCDAGHDQNGNGVSTCGADGVWTTPAITCVPKDCGKAPEGVNADIKSTITSVGATATYTCQEGYEKVNGEESLSCLASGSWEEDPLNCVAIDCGQAPVGVNADIKSTLTTVGATATYNCRSGYEKQNGEESLSCLASGSWEEDPLNCVEIAVKVECLDFVDEETYELVFSPELIGESCETACVRQTFLVSATIKGICWCGFRYGQQDVIPNDRPCVNIDKPDFKVNLDLPPFRFVGCHHIPKDIALVPNPEGLLNYKEPSVPSAMKCRDACMKVPSTSFFTILNGTCYCSGSYWEATGNNMDKVALYKCFESCKGNPANACITPYPVFMIIKSWSQDGR